MINRGSAPGQKRCPGCGQTKPLDGFHRDRTTKSGRCVRCKICHNAAVTARRYADHDKNREIGKRHYWKCKSNPARYRKMRTTNDIGVSAWRERNPDKYRAIVSMQRAVRSGELIRADRCQAQGCTETRTEGHHENYSHPLEVQWLCRAHHQATHRGELLSLKGGYDDI